MSLALPALNKQQGNSWTKADFLSIEALGINFSEIWIKIQRFSTKKIHLKMPSAKWRPFCSGLMSSSVWWVIYEENKFQDTLQTPASIYPGITCNQISGVGNSFRFSVLAMWDSCLMVYEIHWGNSFHLSVNYAGFLFNGMWNCCSHAIIMFVLSLIRSYMEINLKNTMFPLGDESSDEKT